MGASKAVEVTIDFINKKYVVNLFVDNERDSRWDSEWDTHEWAMEEAVGLFEQYEALEDGAFIDKGITDKSEESRRSFDLFVERMHDKQAQAEAELNAVMTTSEVEETFNLAQGVARNAALAGVIPARKSGGAWLIRRADAVAKWGKRISKSAGLTLLAVTLAVIITRMM